MKALFFAIAASLVAHLPTAQADETLEITIENIEIPKGKLYIGIFDSAEEFKTKENPLTQSPQPTVTATGNLTTSVQLPAGTYAFVVFQDLNGNGEVDFGKWGIPIEPMAFSRMPVITIGPPSFSSAKFTLPTGGKKMTVKLRHWKG